MGYYTKNGGLIGVGRQNSKIGIFDVTAAQIWGDVLYAFSSFTFTNAGKTGREGPTLAQCQSAYAGQVWLNNYFNVSNQGIQEWTVPKSGNYQFILRGANGVPSTGASGQCAI